MLIIIQRNDGHKCRPVQFNDSLNRVKKYKANLKPPIYKH